MNLNFNNYKKSNIHEVFDKVCELANDRGVRVTGSEIVGLMPLESLLECGKYYLKKQKRSTGLSEDIIIDCDMHLWESFPKIEEPTENVRGTH